MSARLITDWVTKGLLDRPRVRGLGRGKGTVATWPESQRRLFLLLLDKRDAVSRSATLCNIPVTLWLFWGDAYAPLRQVRRALKTWVDAYGAVSHTKAKSSAEKTLLQLDHPNAREQDRVQLRLLLTQSAKTGRFDKAAVAELARRVADPHETGLARGPWGLLDANALATLLHARITALANLDNASDDAYRQARDLYRNTGPTDARLRDPQEAQAFLSNPGLRYRTTFKSIEAAVNDACIDFITTLGFSLLTPPFSPSPPPPAPPRNDNQPEPSPGHKLAPATAPTARGHGTRKRGLSHAAPAYRRRQRGIVVAHGYGIKINVQRRHLSSRTASAAAAGPAGSTGTAQAQPARADRPHRLHHARRAAVAARHRRRARPPDANGELIAASVARGPDLAGLRRAQALAADGAGRRRDRTRLLAAKVEGQRALLDELPGGPESIEPVEWALREIHRAADLPRLLAAEAQAANAYWQAWSTLPIPFPPREAGKLPEHWLTFGQRASLHHRRPAAGDQPRRRDPQLPVRAAGSRDDPRLPRARARSRRSGSSTPTSATAHRSRSTRWKPHAPRSTPTCSRCSPSARCRRASSSRPARAPAGSPQAGRRTGRHVPGLAASTSPRRRVGRAHARGALAGAAAAAHAAHAPQLEAGMGRARARSPPPPVARRVRRAPQHLPRLRDSAARPPPAVLRGVPRPALAEQGPAARQNSRRGARPATRRAARPGARRTSRRAPRTQERRPPSAPSASGKASGPTRRSSRGDPARVARTSPIAELVAATGLSEHYCSLIRLGKKSRIRGIGRRSARSLVDE